MNDQYYIKAAVELADGWKITHDEFSTYAECLLGRFILPGLPTIWLAALAAQLTEQVDVLLNCDLVSRRCGAELNVRYEDDLEKVFSESVCGRAMNTIKAVVDSKMLK